MGMIFLLLVLAVIPAYIASQKGRSFGLWYVYGIALFIVALIHSLCISKKEKKKTESDLQDEGLRKCPYCAEYIKREALICRFCGKELSPVGLEVAGGVQK